MVDNVGTLKDQQRLRDYGLSVKALAPQRNTTMSMPCIDTLSMVVDSLNISSEACMIAFPDTRAYVTPFEDVGALSLTDSLRLRQTKIFFHRFENTTHSRQNPWLDLSRTTVIITK